MLKKISVVVFKIVSKLGVNLQNLLAHVENCERISLVTKIDLLPKRPK